MLNEPEKNERKEHFKNYRVVQNIEKTCLVEFNIFSEKYPRRAILKYSSQTNNEVQISKLFSDSSKFFVTYYDSLFRSPNSKIEMFYEYCEKGSLRKKIANCLDENKHLNKEMVLFQFANLAEALHNCHKTLAHRDIKPDNIFITSNNIFKIGDFDISSFKQDSGRTLGKNKGTLFYMPEKHKNKDSKTFDKNDLLEIDIYSFIKTFAEVLNPFNPNFFDPNSSNHNHLNHDPSKCNCFLNWLDILTRINEIGFQENEISCLTDGFNCSRIVEFSSLKTILKSALKRNFSNMTEVNYICYVCGENAFDNNFIILTDQCNNHVAHVNCFSGYWNCTANKTVCPICDAEIDVSIIENLDKIMKFNLDELDYTNN